MCPLLSWGFAILAPHCCAQDTPIPGPHGPLGLGATPFHRHLWVPPSDGLCLQRVLTLPSAPCCAPPHANLLLWAFILFQAVPRLVLAAATLLALCITKAVAPDNWGEWVSPAPYQKWGAAGWGP